MLGISRNSVKTHLGRGLDALERILESDVDTDTDTDTDTPADVTA